MQTAELGAAPPPGSACATTTPDRGRATPRSVDAAAAKAAAGARPRPRTPPPRPGAGVAGEVAGGARAPSVALGRPAGLLDRVAEVDVINEVGRALIEAENAEREERWVDAVVWWHLAGLTQPRDAKILLKAASALRRAGAVMATGPTPAWPPATPGAPPRRERPGLRPVAGVVSPPRRAW